jgi:FkbM family methyltransferase
LGCGQRYVETLAEATSRNLTLPHEFQCFTDDRSTYAPTIVKRELPQLGLRGWWNKIALFKPGLFPDGARILYLDLDTLITGCLDDIASYDGEFAMLAQFFNNVSPIFAGPQSGVMVWRAGFGEHIWQTYVNTDYPDLPGGDQAFLRHVHPNPDLLQDLYPGAVVSFKQVGGIVPAQAAIACFHGQPHVHQVFPDGWAASGATPIEDSMKKLGGFWWPIADLDCWRAMLASADHHISATMLHVPQNRRRLCVQAGGNVGVYTALLADRFACVFSFEPGPENFRCLQRNLGDRQNVTLFNAALAEPGQTGVELTIYPENAGKARVSGVGNIAATTIDDLALEACDLICLDIEGYEMQALRGAASTIRAHRPVIVIEDNGLSEAYGVPQGRTPQWLIDTFGYRIAARVGRDVILTPKTED